MIGDGVNDVPAMKASRLAIAFGAGSQLAKSVADAVLVTDEFAVLPGAVGAGAAHHRQRRSASPGSS